MQRDSEMNVDPRFASFDSMESTLETFGRLANELRNIGPKNCKYIRQKMS